MKYKQPTTIFVAIVTLAIFIAYVSGFDFDQRNPEIGFFTSLTLVVAIGVSVVAYLHPEL